MPKAPTIAVKESRADLLEIGPSTGLSGFRLVYVIGKGLYRWRTGDQSGNVPSGNDSDRWIAPSEDTSGASGAWQRDATDVSYIDTFTAGHIDGLELSNGTDAAHDIDIATGVCSMRDGSGNRKLFNLTSGLTKQIDANWAEGMAAGGFPSGLTLSADTWYRVFLIGKDDGTVDAGFDTDASATNLLADATSYSWFRHVRWVVTDGSSNILPTIQDGDFVWHDVTVNDRSGANPGTAAVIITTTAPPDTKAVVNCRVIDNSPAAQTSVLVTSPYQTDTAPTSNLASFSVAVSASDEGVSWEGVVKTNASSQIRIRFSNSDAAVSDKFNTVGWIDDRGRNA